MIYDNLNLAKEDLKWLLGVNTIISDSTNALNSKKVEMILENLTSFDAKYLELFYVELFSSLDFESLSFSKDISKQFLPNFAIVPNFGVVFIYEQTKEGEYKAQSKDGIKIFKSFPANTRFANLRKKEVSKEKTSAYEMFKKVALEQKRLLVYAAAATFSINTLALGTSLYTMQVYDRVVPTGAISTLVALTIGVFIAIFLEMMIKFSRSVLLDYATKKMDIEYSNDIFERFLRIRCDALPKSIGTLTGQLQSYNNVRAFITSAAMFLFIDLPFSIIFILAIFVIGGFAMGLVPIGFLILSLIVGFIFRKKIEQASKNSSMASYKKMGLMVETVENSENIKATGAGFNILNNWNRLTQEAVDDDIEIRHYSDMSSYITAFLQQLSYIAIVSLGAYLVAENGTITMGALIAMTILSGRILQPIAQLPNQFVQWGKASLAVKDLDNVYKLASDNDGIDRPLSPYLDTTNIRCKDISFGYTENSNVISVSELNIKQGEKVAILGAIGSGKSTFLKILAGLYKPTKGFVYLDGIDMQLIKRDFLTENMSYLPQTTKLFAGTLRDNLIFGMIGISDEQIIEAAKLTGLIGLINALPNGLDTVVPEGGESVSGGQKQLIALTRMIVANKKIILLDEPTASMDEGTERQIISMLHQKLSPEQTMVVVTHKPIVLNMVDRIIVLTPNGVAVDGTKEEVLAKLTPKKQ
ncbi:ATP-binding cassette domain-containing protein [Arcobacter cryaerophilus gv. pseudocryaerophilus]|uniref:ATP-binding cassette domain-containing protein n=3 Tax=unclassified Arcobacter TaxID=2593671 RepID=A0AA96RC62_9BACT|nr:ATP-binding cassette domain-containing protein [Arcobacter sp. AZ-2023]WPD06206.1 ATP-binding cassette domain-containing protein [Arcobacter sp. DSM 115956]WPD08297.1 ATP-binding cassette domain-containing protein [Arcobacter sp. DSM 115955]WNL32562.1 ATP-binding cassette domain-containing protein [Arcobacter sp. AZ-2023]WNP38712.1 ATP-binding cassette domain-containing protein [Arcobacter sp. AZ-2023]